MTHTIQLDIAAGCPFEEIIKDTLKFDIAAKLITLIGPGGGNSIYEFYGTFDLLTSVASVLPPSLLTKRMTNV